MRLHIAIVLGRKLKKIEIGLMIYTFLYIYDIPTPALKNPPAMQGTQVQFLDQEDPLEKG